MESQENNQLELFSQTQDKSSARTSRSKISFLANIRQYEKIILIIIAIIIVSIISFSFGVEKGRKVISKVYREEQPVRVSQPVDKAQVVVMPQSAEESPGAFTVQVASFKSKTLAQKEAQDIKKRGLNPIVLPKGVYTVVCIGNFVDKKDAQAAISGLKKRYQGCFVRRL